MGTVQTIRANKNQRPGEVLLQHGLAGDALPHLLEARKQEPSHWRHHLNLAVAYRYLGRFDEAYEGLHAAKSLCPEAWPIYHTWANVLDDLGQFQTSLDMRWKAWDLSKRSRQEVALGLGVSLLRKGDWTQAWPYWEMGRFAYSWAPPSGVGVWQGEPIEGKKVLVLSEGGYGDIFQFSRWLPYLTLHGHAIVTLCVWERQIELLKQSPEMAGMEFTAVESEMDVSRYDYCTSILSLPAIFRATPKTVPPAIGFDVQGLERVTGRKRIGICWKAEENGSVRKVRSIPSEQIEKLKRVDADWFSIVPRETLDWMQPSPDGWLDTARFLKSLDLVLTVDTAVLHLAGCLGVPSIAMLPVNSEWRWGVGDTGAPWYGNMRLVRQKRHDEWDGVIEDVEGLLHG